MKIGLVLDDTLDKPDGVQQYVLLLGEWLSSQGHTVHYLVGQSSRTDIANVHSLSRNVKVRFNGNRLTIPLPASRRRIKALLRSEKFDVLHVQMPYSPFMAGRVIAAAPQNTAIIGTFHILPFSKFEQLAAKLLGYILRPTLRRFSRIVAVSAPAAEFASYAFGVNAEVVPNMVDVKKFSRHSKVIAKDRFTISYIGRLVPRKGVQELLRALLLIPEELRKTLRVTIGGKGELAGALQEYVELNNLGDVVEIIGFVAEDDKPEYLAGADIAIFPSLSGESFGIVLAEGMAAGGAVVMGGDNPGYRSVLARWPETLCKPSDESLFAEQLTRMIQDPKLRQRIYKEQQEAVRAYDTSVVGTKILDIYQSQV